MKAKISLLATTILILTITLTVTAQPRPKPPKDFGFDKGRIVDLLKLTDEQKSRFYDFFFSHQQKAIDLKSGIQKVRLNIGKMMAENDINEEQLINLTEKVSQLERKLKQLKIEFWLNVYKILNNDQKEIWTSHFRHFWGMKHHPKFAPPVGRAGRSGFRGF